MPLFNMTSLRASLRSHERLLGIDPGTRTIGLALSDVSLLLASPYGRLKRSRLAINAAEIQAIAQKEGAAALVCGLPLELNGSFGPAAQASRDWLLALSERTSLPAAMWDERLTSAAINRLLIEELDTSRQRRAQLVDKMAAAYILQAALDATRAKAHEHDERDGGRDRD